jgi:hypothetical protein
MTILNLKYKIMKIFVKLCIWFIRKSEKSNGEKAKLLAKELVNVLDYNENEGVKSISIYWDFNHHPKREIHISTRNSFDEILDFVLKTNKKNKNYKSINE